MFHYFRCNLINQKCLFGRIFLLLVWLSGLLFGVCVASGTGSFASSLMRGIFSDTVSIVSLFSVSIVPFLLSAFAVYMGFSQLLYLICFIKAFCFGFVSCLVHMSFGYAGWLAQLLLMFSDLFSVPLLFLFWMRHISCDCVFLFSKFILTFALLALIGSIDYCFVLPFLAML